MTALPLCTPSAVDVDAQGVLALLDALEADPAIEMHSLMVLRHGTVLAAGWWAPYSAQSAHLLYSLSKSFTSTALGLAVAEGLVTLDDRVVDHFADLAVGVTDERTSRMLVRHLASMATGHLDDTWQRVVAADVEQPVRGFLRLPPEREPGSVFAYNQSATYTLATLLQRVTGETLTDYLRPRLLDPLGIGPVGWQQHPAGQDLGFTGLHATTDAVARLGQLYLQRGRWGGRQLLSQEWVAEATRVHVANPDQPNPDWRQGYGFQFWNARHGYRGDGAFGQFCLVLGDQDLVVASTAATEAMQSVLDAVWEHLLPAVDRGSSDAADRELAERLDRLAVPEPPAASPPAEPWPGGVLAPSGGTCAAQPSLRTVEVEQTPDGWRLALVEAGDASAEDRLELDAIGRPWPMTITTVPTAVAGGWTPDGGLRFDVRFLETPHTLVVTCHPSAGTFDARWTVPPLAATRLRRLRSPGPSR